ncbi:MAG: hypothetical protein M0P95_17965 [Sulfuritalea sp.]|nr:hypothetical protein [Sulfuritalea sp.]
MSTVVVTIGRNKTGILTGAQAPMSWQDWMAFKRAIFTALRVPDGTILQHPQMTVACPGQVGTWEGVDEEAAAFVALIPDHLIEVVKGAVKLIRYTYGQEYAGFIVASGDRHLV